MFEWTAHVRMLLLIISIWLAGCTLDTDTARFESLVFYELTDVHTDAGGINTCKNIRRYAPENRDQLIALVTAADQSGRKVVLVGSGHSMAGQVACDNEVETTEYLLLSLEKLPINYSHDGESLTVSAQATWRDVIQFLKREESGLAPSIMQDFNVFTVAGSISANGMGRDPNFGPVIDSVQSFTLLKANGESIKCSRSMNTDCFQAVIGGYGAFGVILDVTLSLVPDVMIRPLRFRLTHSEYADHLNSRVVGEKELDKHFGLVEVDNGQIFVNVVEYYKAKNREHIPEALRQFAQTSHHPLEITTRREYLDEHRFSFEWGQRGRSSQLLSVAIPLPDHQAFILGIPKLLEHLEQLTLHEITTKYVPRPESENLLPLVTTDSVVFVFMIESLPEYQHELEEFKGDLYTLVRSLNGRPYLAFDLPKANDWLRELYPHVSKWLALKKTFDPGGTFDSKFLTDFVDQFVQSESLELTHPDKPSVPQSEG